ncbi:MAG: hypothetical protein GF308_17630 [Candidatus Heimdallarchaeota archaeon]|nr:hypothetical protein [Candidatus Heimdallarchaeota archaeon]
MPDEQPPSKNISKDTSPETTAQSPEKEPEAKPQVILEEFAISSINLPKEILNLDEKQEVSLVIDYSANEDCQIDCQIVGSNNCRLDFPETIPLPSKNNQLALQGELVAQKAGETTITIELTYQQRKTCSSFKVLILPDVSLTFKDIPEPMVPVKKAIDVSLSCRLEMKGGQSPSLQLSLIDGRRIVDTRELSQSKASAIYHLTYQAKSPGFKTLKAKITFQKKLLAQTKASEDILVYLPRDIPGELVNPEIFIGKKSQFDVLYLATNEKNTYYKQMRKAIKALKTISYLAFSFPETSEEQWPDIKDFFLSKSKAPFLLLFSLLPIEQRLIIIPVDNCYEEFKLKKMCHSLNDKLRKKIKGEFITQEGLLAKGAFRDFFSLKEPKDKQTISIIASVGFLDSPKLLAKALKELVTELSRII